MDYIYKYTDNLDGIVKYIGRSKRKLDCRINEHENLDNWVSTGKWKIEYFPVPNQSYSEAIESHLIAVYKTYEWFNKAKNDWGVIQEFLNSDFKWRLYSNNGIMINLPYDYLPVIDDKEINHGKYLITDKELSYDFELPIEEIWIAAGLDIIQPLAKTSNEELLFLEDDIQNLLDYLNTKIDREYEL